MKSRPPKGRERKVGLKRGRGTRVPSVKKSVVVQRHKSKLLHQREKKNTDLEDVEKGKLQKSIKDGMFRAAKATVPNMPSMRIL